MRPRVFRAVQIPVLFGWAVLFTGCTQPGVPITGGAQSSAAESETAAATSYNGKNILVVTSNDETNTSSTIQYTSTTRKVLTGASLMGWSYSVDQGEHWTFGGKVSPPKGWAVLWGDPAITGAQQLYRYVFLSNLAIPASKMPSGGIDGSVIISGADSYIGGACIARSTDGGMTFQNYQCVANTQKNSVPNSEKGHFYDGGSMASSSNGDIYAAYVDVTTGQIDVWHSPSLNGAFTMLATPFPGMDIVTHPRLRVDPASNALYVAAQASNTVIYINRYAGGSWGSPVQATDTGAIYPCIAFEANGCDDPTKLSVRTGPQFSFDIGASSDANNSDAIRFLYTRLDSQSGHYYVSGSFCPLSLQPGCYPAPEWGTTPGNLSITGDEFNPSVSAWRGFIALPPAWKGVYLHRPDPMPSKVVLSQGNLAYLSGGKRIFIPFDVSAAESICPDQRGYWGDYDHSIHAGFASDMNAVFFRAMSDSSPACAARWAFTSNPVHVRGFVFE